MMKKWIVLALVLSVLLCGCTSVNDKEDTTPTQTETPGQDLAGGEEDVPSGTEDLPAQGDVSTETKPNEDPDPTQSTGEPTPPDAPEQTPDETFPPEPVDPPSGTTTPPESGSEETTVPPTPSDSVELPDDDWT